MTPIKPLDSKPDKSDFRISNFAIRHQMARQGLPQRLYPQHVQTCSTVQWKQESWSITILQLKVSFALGCYHQLAKGRKGDWGLDRISLIGPFGFMQVIPGLKDQSTGQQSLRRAHRDRLLHTVGVLYMYGHPPTTCTRLENTENADTNAAFFRIQFSICFFRLET